MKKIRLAMVGGGTDSLIGILHRLASKSYDRYDIVAGCFSINEKVNQESASQFGVSLERTYKDIDTLIEEELRLPENQRVEVVSVLTPNFLHYPMSKKLIENGFHVICEKPMTTSYEEALDLQKTITKTPVVFALTHTYTGYPMVRQIRQMVEAGALGEIQKVDVKYYQGWINPIIHEKEKRNTIWRLDPKKAGISSCMADIGVHAFNMLEFTTGLQVQEILANLNMLYDDNELDVDGTVMLKLNNGSQAILRASQIASCEENNLSIAVYGRKGMLKWEQQNPNYVYFMTEGSAMQVLKPGYDFNTPLAVEGTKMPPGHPEGIFDAMGNIYQGVAKAISGENYDKGEFPTLLDGVRGMDFIEKSVASHKEGNIWISIH